MTRHGNNSKTAAYMGLLLWRNDEQTIGYVQALSEVLGDRKQMSIEINISIIIKQRLGLDVQ